MSDCHRCPVPRFAFAAVRGTSVQEIPEGSREPVSEFSRWPGLTANTETGLKQIQPDRGLVRCHQGREGRHTEEEERGDRAAPQGQTMKQDGSDGGRAPPKESTPEKRWVIAVVEHVRRLRTDSRGKTKRDSVW